MTLNSLHRGMHTLLTICILSADISTQLHGSWSRLNCGGEGKLRGDISADNKQIFTQPPSPGSEEPDPCNRKLSEKPNFNAIGRRVSEAKCNEFQWDLQRQEEEKQKNVECKKYRMKITGAVLIIPVILGGRNTEPGEFPHMGALGWQAVVGDWKFQCGCTLISTKFLLTAAHCSSASPRDTTIVSVKPEIVRLGVTNIVDWRRDRRIPYDEKILQILVHPQYVSPKKYYDIAIVELTRKITFNDYIQPACLWTHNDTSPLGSDAFATGWGYVNLADRQTSSELQAGKVDIVDSGLCDALLEPARNRHFSGLQPHQLCAGVLDGGVDACQGDSGGPLQVKIPSMKRLSYVIGVTSFGKGCARANSPGVYTRVSSFIDWIESVVWQG